MYEPGSGRRLPVTGVPRAGPDDRLLVGPIDVQPGRVGAEARPGHSMVAWLGGEQLLGYDLHPLGRDQAPAEVARGQDALLTLYWRAGEHPDPAPAKLRVRLDGPAD